jgi:hypothetical protein
MAGVVVDAVEILTIGAGSAASLSIVMMPEMAVGMGAGGVVDGRTMVPAVAESGNGIGTTTTLASTIADVLVTASGRPVNEGSAATAISIVTASGRPVNVGSPGTAISCVTTSGEIVSKESAATIDLAGSGNAIGYRTAV